jgi:hypothetical protein
MSSEYQIDVKQFLLPVETYNIENPTIQVVSVLTFLSKKAALDFQSILTTKVKVLFGSKEVRNDDFAKRVSESITKTMEISQATNLVDKTKLINKLKGHISEQSANTIGNKEAFTLSEIDDYHILSEPKQFYVKIVVVVPDYKEGDFNDVFKGFFKDFYGTQQIVDKITDAKFIANLHLISTQYGGRKRNVTRKSPKIHVGKRGGKYYIKNGKKVYV